MASSYAERTSSAPTFVPLRLFRCVFRQSTLNPRCPSQPRLDGKRALVTGGNAGLGLYISKGLAERGAQVVIAARNEQTGGPAAKEIGAEWIGLDLSDLDSVARATDALGQRPLDRLIANAGLWPRQHSVSKQGHELAFATNLLGHYVLIRRALGAGVLAKHARIVLVTGDIYIRARDCTPDFTYRGAGTMAYCRSKLGVLWFAAELQRRHPELEVCAVHPGVVFTNLGRRGDRRAPVQIDPQAGAQTPLFCATQPIVRGAYYHNTLGRVRFRPSDPAANSTRASELWQQLESLGRRWLA